MFQQTPVFVGHTHDRVQLNDGFHTKPANSSDGYLLLETPWMQAPLPVGYDQKQLCLQIGEPLSF